jgi:hypothetical protein
MRFYARNHDIDPPHFKTDVDADNWWACHNAIRRYSEKDKNIILRVYGLYDTIADNVYEIANLYHIDQNEIWDLLKEFEKRVAQKRGLL